MQRTELLGPEAAILTRLASPGDEALSAAAAEGILSIEFSRIDKDRMRALTAKARAGTLAQDEQSEVEAYSRISSFLGILKSRARRALNRHAGNGKAHRPGCSSPGTHRRGILPAGVAPS